MFEFNEDNIESEKNFKKIDLSTSPPIITESNVTSDNCPFCATPLIIANSSIKSI